MFKIAYILVSASSMGLLLFEAPSGALLTSTPERGKVQISQPVKGSGKNPTVRGGPGFIWLGGGYHGGK
ncbi:MAG: hypothetical protein K0V04_24535 [Deltaproteobacteria bacterium]|nr:hypothetical protein [Deltaproteobacteria bacterium]